MRRGKRGKRPVAVEDEEVKPTMVNRPASAMEGMNELRGFRLKKVRVREEANEEE